MLNLRTTQVRKAYWRRWLARMMHDPRLDQHMCCISHMACHAAVVFKMHYEELLARDEAIRKLQTVISGLT